MIPIELLRVRVGLDPSDTSEDPQLTLADTIATSILETWLDRRLSYGEDKETFTHWRGDRLSLRRYPIEEGTVAIINATSLGFPATWWHVDNRLGIMFLDGRAHEHQFTVAYTGGYQELPPDLLAVALLVFDSVWSVLGAGAGEGVTESGAIRSISIPDVGTIQYATSSDGSALVQGTTDYGMPAIYAGIVERHRRIFA